MKDERRLFVQYGCGFSAGADWENFDASPTLRIERVPFVGRFISVRFSGNSQLFPDLVRYGNIVDGLPIADGAANGCYASHVLEHLSLEDLRLALANTYRMLSRGGIFRLIVPDLLARAECYVGDAKNGSAEAAMSFLRESLLGQEKRLKGVAGLLRSIVGDRGHLWMWDEVSMTAELKRAGFADIRRCKFGDSAEEKFSQVEDRSRFIDPTSGIVECALEARKA